MRFIETDLSRAGATLGYIEEITKEISTSRHIGAIVEYVATELLQEFDKFVDTLAKMDHSSYHHVYEWAGQGNPRSMTVGNPAARLWRHNLKGSRTNRKRVSSFEFLPSVVAVPVDETLLEPGKNGKTVKTGVHRFVWKAPVMEYGLEVTIEPKLAKSLAFPSSSTDSGIRFVSAPVKVTPGKKTAGKFTAAYMAFFSGVAQSYFDDVIRPRIESGAIDPSEIRGAVARAGRKSNKAFSFQAGTEAGKQHAMEELRKDRSRYIKEAARRREELYGN